ncbi:MAG: D-aminoacyl-tRNA deacylase [Halobacteriales archaeon]
MIGIVVSRADEASVHIGERLLELADWTEREDESRADAEGGGAVYRHEAPGGGNESGGKGHTFELREFEDLHLHLDGVAGAFPDPELLAFVSRHAGETGPLLSAHFTGNVGPGEYGGADGDLARAAPNAGDRVLSRLREHAPEGYDVAMECTHHGPSEVGAPSLFVEVGSAKPQWRDAEAAEAVARAVLDLSGASPDSDRTVVGFGGGHYAPRFERIARETDWAVGHVAADWGLEALAGSDIAAERVIEQVFAESGATRAVLDGDWPEVAATIADLGYDAVSETWLRETSGVGLALAGRLEDALSPVEDGLRFGERARQGTTGTDIHPEVHSLPADLLSDLQGIDAERTREAVAAHALAYETEAGGTRIAGSIAVPNSEAYDGLLDAVCEILADRYEHAERADDELHVTERAFHPAKARERGVPEGPAFGRLADGQPVEVDGETVDPEDVHETRRRTYHL